MDEHFKHDFRRGGLRFFLRGEVRLCTRRSRRSSRRLIISESACVKPVSDRWNGLYPIISPPSVGHEIIRRCVAFTLRAKKAQINLALTLCWYNLFPTQDPDTLPPVAKHERRPRPNGAPQ